jgi:hypothetical protein
VYRRTVAGPPLSPLLSQLLVACTIELDDEFEHRLAADTWPALLVEIDGRRQRRIGRAATDELAGALREVSQRIVADPRGRLPHHPMVRHRGGWPDGS